MLQRSGKKAEGLTEELEHVVPALQSLTPSSSTSSPDVQSVDGISLQKRPVDVSLMSVESVGGSGAGYDIRISPGTYVLAYAAILMIHS